jgi:hypothetical protein
MLKKSPASGSETLERLKLALFGQEFCSNLGIETGFRLDVATGTLFFNKQRRYRNQRRAAGKARWFLLKRITVPYNQALVVMEL